MKVLLGVEGSSTIHTQGDRFWSKEKTGFIKSKIHQTEFCKNTEVFGDHFVDSKSTKYINHLKMPCSNCKLWQAGCDHNRIAFYLL